MKIWLKIKSQNIIKSCLKIRLYKTNVSKIFCLKLNKINRQNFLHRKTTTLFWVLWTPCRSRLFTIIQRRPHQTKLHPPRHLRSAILKFQARFKDFVKIKTNIKMTKIEKNQSKISKFTVKLLCNLIFI